MNKSRHVKTANTAMREMFVDEAPEANNDLELKKSI